MTKTMTRIMMLALCLMVATVFMVPPAVSFGVTGASQEEQAAAEQEQAAAEQGQNAAAQKQISKDRQKNAKAARSEEEAAGKRADNTGVADTQGGKDKVTAEQSRRDEQEDKKNVTVSTYETSDSDVDIDAKGAIIFVADTGEVLYGKNANKAYDPLSVTKIMTALMVMKQIEAGNLSMDDYATCTAEDTKVMEVKMYLQKGEKMKIRDLLYAAMLESDNDAAAILGSHIGWNKAGFAKMMNEQAALLGCKNTVFTNANGLIEGNLHSTPYDMALIAREAFKYKELRKICQTKKYKMPSTKLRPGGWTAELTNPFFYPKKHDKAPNKTYNIQGGKTGTWDYSNASLLEVAEFNGHQIITMVMKAPLNKRYSNTRRLLNYAKSVFKERAAIEKVIKEKEAKNAANAKVEPYNEYIREIDKSKIAKTFFGLLNKLFRDSCMELDSAYKTKSDDVSLTWEKRPGADGYIVLRSTDGGGYEKVYNTESGDVTKFRDETVEKNHVYRYFVRAYRGDILLPCV